MKLIEPVLHRIPILKPLTNRIHYRPSSLYSSRFLEQPELFHKRIPLLFSSKDESLGYEWLNLHGIGRNERIITVLLRDSAYLANEYKESDFSYHNYRDVDTANYVVGISELINLGYVVIRMGKKQSERIPFSHPKFIDYAFCEKRSDFLDLWLISKSIGMISTGTGQDQIAILNDIPICFVDLAPMAGISQYSNCLAAPKILVSIKDGSMLDVKTQLTSIFYSSDELIGKGYYLRDLEKVEIAECIMEFHKFIQSEGSHPDLIKYRDLVISLDLLNYSKVIHENCAVSSTWMRILSGN
jgi:putative glycosyltransferase (TIGR04372 family)